MNEYINHTKALMKKDILDYIRDPYTVAFMFMPLLLPAILLLVSAGTQSSLSINMESLETITQYTSIAVPMFFIMFTFLSGASYSSDVLSGEWERGTMEQMLTTQIGGMALIMSKVVVILGITILSMIILLLGTSGAFVLLQKETPQIDIYFPMRSILPVGLLLAITCACIMVLISISCKTIRESSFRLGLLEILPVLLGIFNESASSQVDGFIRMFVPLGNLMYLLKQIIERRVTPIAYCCVFGSSFLYIVLILVIACVIFKKIRSSL